MKIILTSKPTYQAFSVEAGKHDNEKHFDHHGIDAPSPCNNKDILPIKEDSFIEITHFDADTFIGILRLLGKDLPENIDMSIMEQIDNNGTLNVTEYDRTLLYMTGLKGISHRLDFPRVTEGPINVTNFIHLIINTPLNDIIDEGKKIVTESHEAYDRSFKNYFGGICLFSVGEKDSVDVSMAYKKGHFLAIVYRERYKSISLYAHPESHLVLNNKKYSNILFEGHEKACGSPRGIEYTFEDARTIYEYFISLYYPKNREWPSAF